MVHPKASKEYEIVSFFGKTHNGGLSRQLYYSMLAAAQLATGSLTKSKNSNGSRGSPFPKMTSHTVDPRSFSP
jgi:hypothetical protein